MPAADVITLSLISHTNAGKTTLARTLLRHDVGEVRDAPHVTQFNESHTLLSASGYTLRLWDTPGFGDSGRLLKRLRTQSNAILWFITQSWDRLTDKPLWCSQQALRNVKEEADVVLYLVNASEQPQNASYVTQEMEILGWVGKPVLVLLNQTGPARPLTEELQDVAQWQSALHDFSCVKAILPLDGFTRCWVQEDQLMTTLRQLVAKVKLPALQALQAAWHSQHMQTFQQATSLLGKLLTASLQDSAKARPETALEWLGLGRAAYNRELATARQALSTRLAERMEHATNDLIALHGLAGQASKQLVQVSRDHFQQPTQVSESILGAVGGAVAGAMAGLWADLHAGGMTFGGGAIVGGLGGGLSAYAVAKGYNLARGEGDSVHWSREHFREQARLALLCYLAVAHYGRGRGEWQQTTVPTVWSETVEAVIEQNRSAWDHAWKQRTEPKGSEDVLHRQLASLAHSCALAALRRLYPSALIAS
jgi:GTP-binding protein EngB required for normal cell division